MARVLIVGAGAAGLMAAGAAVRQGHQVTVLEHTEKPGQKILVTGKGRCNMTNDCPAEEFLRHVRTNPRFLYSSLGAFPPAKTMELFEGLGVELKVERGRRVFPVSDKAEEIRRCCAMRRMPISSTTAQKSCCCRRSCPRQSPPRRQKKTRATPKRKRPALPCAAWACGAFPAGNTGRTRCWWLPAA
jgi:predicted flavoprotein YhiN